MPAAPSNSTLRALLSRRMLVMLLQGFASGIPLALTASTLQAWMKDEKIDITVIGLFSLVGLPYSFKFIWSPLLDRFSLPFLGHRRGWLIVSQILLIVAIGAMALSNPSSTPVTIGVAAVIVAFLSASQDILTDAYRVESLHKEEFAFGLSVYTTGYRLAMITSGAVAVGMADHYPWRTVYLAMAATMLVGLAATLIAEEPQTGVKPLRTFEETVVQPLSEFFGRRGWAETLIFVLIYKLDTNLTVALMTAFFMDVGFTKTDIAAITKVFGMVALISGGLVAGLVMTKWSLRRALVIFGILQAVASMSFLSVAHFGKSYPLLVVAIGTENFFSGMGVAALGAFMMSLVNKRYSATQYALITSFMGLSRYLTNAPSGYLVKAIGWEGYYVVCGLIGIPGLLMLSRYPKWRFPENA
jgi:PAT family beta-lactamase induction signal transducer AmpG